MTTPNIDTKALRELEAKATKGPWIASGFGGVQMDGYRDKYEVISEPQDSELFKVCWMRSWDGESRVTAHNNASLVAALRNAAPALLDLAERAQGADQAIADLQAHVARAEDALWDRNEERLAVREAIGLKCRTVEEDMGCGCLMFSAADRAREIVAERDALKAEVAELRAGFRQSQSQLGEQTRENIRLGESVGKLFAERDRFEAKLSASEREAERLRADVAKVCDDWVHGDTHTTDWLLSRLMPIAQRGFALRGEEAPRE